MILIVVRFTVRPEFADSWTELTADFTAATRAEAGNLWFDWYRSTEQPRQYLLCEAFRDDAAEAHVGSEHFRAFTDAAPAWLECTPEIVNTTAEGESWGRMDEIRVD